MTHVTDHLNTALVDRYVIERELGAGGMATVYLAEDLKHRRKVALKVLRPELAAILGAERFLKEIEVTANLQHPNILPLYDSGEAGTFLYYVMPFVDGETLRDQLTREKQLGIEETFEIAKGVGAALQYAHERRIIHRDIKPENVLLQSGQALVADFGIALAVSHAGGTRLTETGLSLGTPHYMSPEQATGDRELDARSDIYSLGAMVYEMLGGDPPHVGSTVQAIVAQILTEDPRPLVSRRRTVPPHIDAAVRKALAKLPADRFATAGQFVAALATPGLATATATTAQTAGPGGRAAARGLHLSLAVLAVGLAGAAAAGGITGWALRPTAAAPGSLVARFRVPVRAGDAAFGSVVEISRDGRQIAFIGPGPNGTQQLFRRPLDAVEASPIVGTEGSLVMMPAFSPTGAEVAFYADQQLRIVPVEGGSSRGVTRMSPTSGGISWGDDDQIVFQPDFGQGLLVVSASGGEARVLTTPDTASGESDHRWPHVLPGGKQVVFTIWRGTNANARIAVATLESGEVRSLLDGTYPRFVDGYLTYASGTGVLHAVLFDAARGEVRGTPVPVLDSIALKGDGSPQIALSEQGTLAYLPSLGSSRPVIIGADGRLTELDLPFGDYQAPRFAPDGRSFAVGYDQEIWVYDLVLGTFGPVTAGGGFYPLWTADGSRLFFSRTEGANINVYAMPADRAQEAAPVFTAQGQHRTQDLSPDGRTLLLRVNNTPAGAAPDSNANLSGATTRQGFAGGQYDLWRLSLDSGAAEPWLQSRFLERAPTFSLNGRWVAYTSDESGRDEVYVRPFPGPGGRTQVSVSGGTEPSWSRDGRALVFREGNRFERVRVEVEGTFRVLSRPEVILEGRFYGYPWQRQYDFHPDGRRILALRAQDEETQLTVVTNWFARERERMERDGDR
jgi:serine/threonine-protein kinase